MTDDLTHTIESTEDDDLNGCRPPLWLVGIALLVLIFVCYGGIRLFSVVYGLVFPPSAPIPADVVELSHEDIENGVNQWRYQTALTPCELVEFYEVEGAVCLFGEGRCEGGVYQRPYYDAGPFATCEALQPFSIFAFRWRVTIDPQYVDVPGASTFTLFSEVLWTGMPDKTSTPPPSPLPEITPETTSEVTAEAP